MNLMKLLYDFKLECEFVSLRSVREKTRCLDARNGLSDKISLTNSNGIMVEVLVEGKFAYSSTNDLSENSIRNCFKRAMNMAKNASKYKIFNFDVSMRGNESGKYSSKVIQSLDSLSLYEIQSRLIKASSELKVTDKIINTQASAIYTLTNILLINSNGLEVEQDFDQLTFDLMSTANDANEYQTRTLGMYCAQSGWEKMNEDFLSEESKRIGRESLELLSAQECPEGNFDLLLAPDQLYLQVHESIGHPLEIDRIIGDERNYAGWSFVSPDDFGSLQYGSSKLNVTFDPNHEGELATFNFDDLGVRASKEYLIKEGKLLRGIGSIESQKRSGILGVSSSRANNWNRPPIDRMANINIEPGNSTFQEMISKTEKGIFMQTNRSWSIDDYRNKFQFGCEYAKLIENGKLTKTIKNPNYRGISLPFWNSLKMVGDESTFEVCGTFYCGKGEPNQIIKVGHAIPACLFESVEVFGGGQ